MSGKWPVCKARMWVHWDLELTNTALSIRLHLPSSRPFAFEEKEAGLSISCRFLPLPSGVLVGEWEGSQSRSPKLGCTDCKDGLEKPVPSKSEVGCHAASQFSGSKQPAFYNSTPPPAGCRLAQILAIHRPHCPTVLPESPRPWLPCLRGALEATEQAGTGGGGGGESIPISFAVLL